MVVRNTSKRLHTLICIGDKFDIGSKYVTHRLEISFGYARHYLDVCRLMTHFDLRCVQSAFLQVTCVNVCQRSYNLPTTYAGLMSHELAYAEHLCACTTFFDDLALLRRIPACFSVLLTYSLLTHNLFDVRQRIRQIFHTSAYAKSIIFKNSITAHYESKISRCVLRLYKKVQNRLQ